MTITTTQVEQYNEKGYFSPISVVDATEASRYRTLFNDLESRVGREKSQIGLVDYHFQEEFIWELATHPQVLDTVEAIAGPNFFLLATHFFCKYGNGPDNEAFVAWHQDVTFWGLEPPYAITAWYAVDDSDQENGCMQVIPGTQQNGLMEHGKSQQKGNLLSINQEIALSPEQLATAVDMPLSAGQMSLHDGTVVHGSLPNRSYRRRCGLTLRYVPTWVKQTEANSYDKRWKGILVRGVDEENNFGALDRPF